MSALFPLKTWRHQLQPNELVEVAQILLKGRKHRPVQTHLRRAISSLYYALFHAIARNCADTLIGKLDRKQNEHAWLEVYRSLGHTTAKAACLDSRGMARFPPDIVDFAILFTSLQSDRHEADYNPRSRFDKSAVLIRLNDTMIMLEKFEKTPFNVRRDFATWLLFRHVTRK